MDLWKQDHHQESFKIMTNIFQLQQARYYKNDGDNLSQLWEFVIPNSLSIIVEISVTHYFSLYLAILS